MRSPGPASSASTRSRASLTNSSRYLRARDRPVGATPRNLLSAPNRPLLHATERKPADVWRGVEVGDECLQRVTLLVDRRGDVLEDELEQRREVWPETVRVGLQRGATCPGIAVDDRKLDLAFVRVEVEEERVDLVHDVGDSRVGAVDLVDDEDDRESRLQRLAEHEARLRQRALARVDEEQDAVDHRQPALHLAAEVGMARSVDDVDLHGAVADGGVLREDRDPLLAFQLPGIEDPLGDILVRAERPGLPEQRIDEGRLAVIDVGDDGDVADVGALRHLPRVPARVAGRLSVPRARSRSRVLRRHPRRVARVEHGPAFALYDEPCSVDSSDASGTICGDCDTSGRRHRPLLEVTSGSRGLPPGDDAPVAARQRRNVAIDTQGSRPSCHHAARQTRQDHPSRPKPSR